MTWLLWPGHFVSVASNGPVLTPDTGETDRARYHRVILRTCILTRVFRHIRSKEEAYQLGCVQSACG